MADIRNLRVEFGDARNSLGFRYAGELGRICAVQMSKKRELLGVQIRFEEEFVNQAVQQSLEVGGHGGLAFRPGVEINQNLRQAFDKLLLSGSSSWDGQLRKVHRLELEEAALLTRERLLGQVPRNLRV